MGKIKFTKEIKDEILKISYKYTSTELSKMYNCSRSTILKLWMDNNYKKGTHNIYYVNKNYFNEIDTANKAYILGFLASDGTLYKRNDNTQGLIQIKLQESDEHILYDILQDMDSTYPVNHVKNGEFTQAVISIASQDLYNQLSDKGLHPNKTWDLNLNHILSNIPEKLHIDFIRGYFDGDGHIGRFNENIISKVLINFACPYNFGLDLQKFFKDKYDINSFIFIDNHREYSNTFCTVGIYSAIDKYKLLKLMYYDEKNLCLKRKCKIAKQVINAIENNVTNRAENIKAVNGFYDNGNTDEVRKGGFGSSGK